MKALNKIFSYVKNLNLRNKLIALYIIFLIVPISFIAIRYYSISLDVVTDLTSKNVYEIIKKNNELIDIKLGNIQENSLEIINDPNLFNVFNNTKGTKNINIIDMDRKVSKVIEKYFGQSMDICSVQIATSYYIFGNNTSYISGDTCKKSSMYKSAVEGEGKLLWIPTYDYTKMFNIIGGSNLESKDKYFFSATRLINSFYLNNGDFAFLDNSIERPVLVINFKEDFFRNEFQNTLTIKGTDFFVLTKEGQVISSNNVERLSSFENYPWLQDAILNNSGTSYAEVNGKKVIVCYDTSKVTGWISVAIIPVDGLMGDIVPVIKSSMFYIAVGISIILLFLIILVSNKITKPIKRLVSAMKDMGKGDFSNRIPEEEAGELKYVVEKFNSLNDKIKKLIEENYETQIREKETEIMALNLQLNPHFLYNTLNIINWMAIKAKNKNVSDMIMKLCEMLVYTIREKKDLVVFKDDLKWLKYYLDIMAVRFENKFTVTFDVNSILYTTEVPKLFLQPLLENAIIHGLEEVEEGGVIKVYGEIENDKRRFIIQDNGKGMTEEKIVEVLHSSSSSIGVYNVNKRIKLLYGKEYGVSIHSEIGKGTIVSVELPLNNFDKSDNSPLL